MKKDYAIGLANAGLAEDQTMIFVRDGMEPREFVEWFAAKYELTKLSDIRAS
jgi:hypothetical protein